MESVLIDCYCCLFFSAKPNLGPVSLIHILDFTISKCLKTEHAHHEQRKHNANACKQINFSFWFTLYLRCLKVWAFFVSNSAPSFSSEFAER